MHTSRYGPSVHRRLIAWQSSLLSSVPVTADLAWLQAQLYLELDHSLNLTLGRGAELSALLLWERSACLYATEEAFWLSRYLLIGV